MVARGAAAGPEALTSDPPAPLGSGGVFTLPFAGAHELQALDRYVLLLDSFLEGRKAEHEL